MKEDQIIEILLIIQILGIIKEKIKVDTKQTEDLFGFDFQIDGKSVTPNEINKILKESTDLEERLKAWEASKEVGKTLKTTET